jgi:phosphoribosylaminoimidazole-succinocarboxamide synthase
MSTDFKPIKEGKVREIYDNGDSLILVATDRISCFDVILNNTVTKKGTVLTQMSKFWFDMTEDILPNHMISVDVNDMPEFFRKPEFMGNSMMVKKLNMLPVECIVRGYITGSGWASYQKTGEVCGIKLPEGLKESDKLPEPIYTPSTKAEIGEHEQLSVSFDAAWLHDDAEEAKIFEAMLGKPVILKTPGGELVVGVLDGYERRDPRFFRAYSCTLQQMHWRDYFES